MYLLDQYGAAPIYDGELANGTQRNGVMTSGIELDPNDGNILVLIEMNANITASLISTSLSADEFKLIANPVQESDISGPSVQVTSPGVTVVSHSVVPVKLKIASAPGVKDVKFSGEFSGYVEQSSQLVDHISGVEPPGTVILILGTQDRQCGSGEDLERYIICPGRAGILVAEIPAEQGTVIKLYGKVTPDFYGKCEFTIKPTLKISAVGAD